VQFSTFTNNTADDGGAIDNDTGASMKTGVTNGFPLFSSFLMKFDEQKR
jgi:hypothetical protein